MTASYSVNPQDDWLKQLPIIAHELTQAAREAKNTGQQPTQSGTKNVIPHPSSFKPA